MDNRKTKNIIEALLIISEGGLTLEDLKTAVDDADEKDILDGVNGLKEEYTSGGRSFNIAEIAGRYRIVTNPEYMPWITNLYERKSDRLTGPSLEALAIIAYKQPVTRAEVEHIRGVNVGGMLKTLLEKGLIAIKGRKNVAGKPLLYGTSSKFLEIFGLSSLGDLPLLKDFSEADLEYAKKDENMLLDNTGETPQSEEMGTAPKEDDLVKDGTDEKTENGEGPITNEEIEKDLAEDIKEKGETADESR